MILSLYLGVFAPRAMRRAAWDVAVLLHCVLCTLATLASAQTPQICVDPATTSTGTENYARMCGVNADAACGATVSSTDVDFYPGPGIAVDIHLYIYI